MKINVSIEARMGSSRLPGKVLKKINNLTILDIMVNRVKRSTLINDVIIATTINQNDDEIVDWCKKQGISYYRGSEDDVLQRVVDCHTYYNTDIIVELTGDCPLIDYVIMDECISFYLDNKYDYVSNCVESSYPDGMDTQVYSLEILQKTSAKATLKRDREHVSSYIYLSGDYTVYTLAAPKHLTRPELGLTLDTLEDFNLIKAILIHFKDLDFDLNDILDYLDNNKKLLELNKDITRKGLN